MNIELHVIENGVDRGVIPSYQKVELSPVFCDYGSISFDYPRNGKKFALLDGKDEIEVVPYLNGIRQAHLGGLVQEIEGDDVAEAAIVSFKGIGFLKLMDEARAFPFGWPDYDPQLPNWRFADATAGDIMIPLMQGAQGRGALQGVTWSFDAESDSTGQPWAKITSLDVAPNTTLTEVLKELVKKGLAEFRMVGRELRMYNPGSLAVDRTQQEKPLTFRRGRDLRDSPRKVSSRDVATVLLGAGKDDTGLYVEEIDEAAVAVRRRIEGYVSSGNLADEGSLRAYLEATLEARSRAKMEKTHGLEFGKKKNPRPVEHFDVGDWAYSDTGKGVEKLRVKQWVLSVDGDGNAKGSVVMNDLFSEIGERLEDRLRAIESGTVAVGPSVEPTGQVPEEITNGIAPKAPEGLAVTSDAYTDEVGQVFAQATASWLPVVENEDGTVCTDLAGYFLRYQTPAMGGWNQQSLGNTTTHSWSPLPPGVELQVQVKAIDKYGNESPWSSTFVLDTGTEDVPPPPPAAPQVDNYLGILRVRWDGAFQGGQPMPPDFEFVEVHVSDTSGFVPGAATLVASLRVAGSAFVETPYDQLRYAKLVAVDRGLNRSDPSAQASGSTGQVVDEDIFDGAVGSAKLSDLAVTTAKIANLAVNNAKISSMEVGKLIAGTLSAEVVLGNRITTALTGQRTEMNAQGFYRFNSSGVATVAIDGAGAFISGRYRTALTGRRLEMGEASQQASEIVFFNGSGQRKGYIDEVLYNWPPEFGAGLFNEWISVGMNTARNTASEKQWDAFFIMDGGNTGGGARASLASDYITLQYHDTGGFTVGHVQNRLDGGGPEVVDDRIYINDDGNLETFRIRPPRSASVAENLSITSASATNMASNTTFGSPNFGFQVSTFSEGSIKYYDDGASIRAICARNGYDFDDGYIAFRGLAYQAASDAVGKENIRPADVDFLEMARTSRPKRYTRKPVRRHDPALEARRAAQGKASQLRGRKPAGKALPEWQTFPEEIGMVAQEAPGHMVSGDPGDLAIDVYQLATGAWGGVGQLADIVLPMREQLDELMAIVKGKK